MDGVPVLLYRAFGTVWALANTCSHMGGSLDEGTTTDNGVTCPWHGSKFSFADGGVLRGPASSPNPVMRSGYRASTSRSAPSAEAFVRPTVCRLHAPCRGPHEPVSGPG
jgi:nitrite reductase/ring-hydroxylating ferredoxin subunit